MRAPLLCLPVMVVVALVPKHNEGRGKDPTLRGDPLPRIIRPLLLALAVVAAFIAAPRSTEASHFVRFSHYWNGNNQPTVTHAVKQWVTLNQPLKWCADGFSGSTTPFAQAVSDWNTTFTSPGFGQPLIQGTLSDCHVRFKTTTASEYAYVGCPANTFACTPFVGPGNLVWDGTRGGWCVTWAVAYFNTSAFGFTDSGKRVVAAHELGHVFGLHERYREPPLGLCSDGGPASIMDIAYPSGATCDGVTGPTSWDKSTSYQFYTPRAAELPSASGNGGTLTYWWWDTNWSEDHAAVHIHRCTAQTPPTGCNSSWVQVAGWQHQASVAPNDGDSGGAVSGTWNRGAIPLAGAARATRRGMR